jgi:ABC-2 type transport system permease protein
VKLRKIINLIHNENMKLYHSISTKIMMGILLLSIIAIGLIVKFTGTQTQSTDWKADIVTQNQEFKKASEMPGQMQITKDSYALKIQTNEYRLENDIPPIQNKSLWGFAEDSVGGLVSLIALFAIIMGGRIVANEFSDGTIKLLLIRPSKRWKILVAKYISIMGYTLLMLLVLMIGSFIIGGILFSFKGAGMPFLTNSNGIITEVNMVAHIIQLCGLNSISLVMMVTLAFMISTVARNSGMAIGIGVFLLTVGNLITLLLIRFNWSKYILFVNTDLNQYINGQPIVEGMTMTFSIIVLIVYFIAFNFISYISFTKRDIGV